MAGTRRGLAAARAAWTDTLWDPGEKSEKFNLSLAIGRERKYNFSAPFEPLAAPSQDTRPLKSPHLIQVLPTVSLPALSLNLCS